MMSQDISLKYYGDPSLGNNILANKIDIKSGLELKVAAESAFLMIDIMERQHGVGLAANQIGLSIPIFVWSYKDHNGVAINPEIVRMSDDYVDDISEGCLSSPGFEVKVSRRVSLTLKANAVDGTEFELDSSGYLARIIQHEMDHLSGKCIVDSLNRESRRKIAKAYR